MIGRLLLIDDEEEVRQVLAALLQREGLAVTLASDGEEALDTLAVLGADAFDFVLCDVQMPRVDGLEFLQRAKAQGCSAPIIVMSGHGTVDTAIEALKLGAYDYISKPFKSDEVVLTLRKAEERERLVRDNRRLRAALRDGYHFDRVVAASPAMTQVMDALLRAAAVRSPVLLEGESGTGKELLARVLHFNSVRQDGPFVMVSCAGTEEHVTRELFGGSSSEGGPIASTARGALEDASAGTVFLEDVDCLPAGVQVRLARLLRGAMPGEAAVPTVSARLVSSTGKNLEKGIKEGWFREDLFYRLSVLRLHLPPLRERAADFPLLADTLVRRISTELGKGVSGLTPEALDVLAHQSWPGNVRELENVLERAVVLADGPRIGPEHLPSPSPPRGTLSSAIPPGELSVKKVLPQVEAELIREALRRTDGNRSAACRLLGLSLRALLYKIKRMGIERG